MLKLLIVDDEPFTREGLRYYFDWAGYDIEVIGEADGGKAALKIIREKKPDIVLTDVRMPDMDGLAMARQIRENDSHIKVIVMSAYDDVDYVKSALRVNALDYILKPVDLDNLAQVIQKVTKIIRHESEEKKLINAMSSKLLQSMPMIQERFLMQLVIDGVVDCREISRKAGFLELSLPENADYCVLIVNVDDSAAVLEGLSERDRQLTSFAVLNICGELINNTFSGYTFENRLDEFVVLLNLNRDKGNNAEVCEREDRLYALISEIQEKLLECLKLSVTIGVGPMVTGVTNVVNSYRKAYENVCKRLFLGKNRIITIDSLDSEEESVSRISFDITEKILNLLKASDEERLQETINQFFVELAKYKYANVKYCRNICFQLLLSADRQLMELEIEPHCRFAEDNKVADSLFRLETLDEMKKLISDRLKAYSMLITEKRDRKANNIIEKIKDVIKKHYSDNLSIRDIAKEVFLSTTYLCMIFKQETGETVNDYLTRVRIERAKDLLKDRNIRLCDICHDIGYTEPGYFSKIFRKYTGLTPSEYRQNMI